VKVLTETDVVVVHVVAPRAEEEVAPAAAETAEAAAEGAVAEPEIIKKGKTAAEGEEAEAKPEKAEKAEKKEKK